MNDVKVMLTDEDLANINGGREIEKTIEVGDDSITILFRLGDINPVPICGKDVPGGNEPWMK